MQLIQAGAWEISPSTLTEINVQTNPPGLLFSVDGGLATAAPLTLKLPVGTVHVISVPTTQQCGNGTQCVFNGWSDGGAAAHSITVGASVATYAASFKTQYQLTISAYPPAGGTVSPANATFFDTGSVVQLNATPNNGYVFNGWAGNVANGANPVTTLTMAGPEVVTALFSNASPAGVGPVSSITAVVNGASFQQPFVPNSWATIVGSSLAPFNDTWANHIVAGRLPTVLDGVSVSVGGQPAYLYYISEGQINFVVPDVRPGPLEVIFTNSSGMVADVTVPSSQYGPAFFSWPNNQVVATRQDFSLAAMDGTFSGITTVPAKPGDVIILWGTGFGPTSPAAPVGVEVPSDQTYATTTLPTVTINNVPASVYGAALAPGYAALYQVAIQVPSSLGNGDWPVSASIGGESSPTGLVLTVQQ